MRLNLQRALITIATATTALVACERSPDSPAEGSGAAESTQSAEEQGISTEIESAGASGSTQEPESPMDTAAQELDLVAVAENLGWARVDDIPGDRLPPMPGNVELRSGIYSTVDGRVGVIAVRYPSDGYVRPHREDIARDTFDVPRAAVYHGQNIVELRSSDGAALASARDALAGHLRWMKTDETGE